MSGKPSLNFFGALVLCLFSSNVKAADQFLKTSENHIFAQTLVNNAMVKNSDLIALGLHAETVKERKLKLIASNTNEIGKFDNDVASSIVHSKRILLIPNLKGFRKYEIQMPLFCADGRMVGWLDFLYKYEGQPDPVALLSKSIRIRDMMTRAITSAQSLFAASE